MPDTDLKQINLLQKTPTPYCGIPESFRLFGIRLADTTLDDAKMLMEKLVDEPQGTPTIMFFIHASTLNLALAEPAYRIVLNHADFIFADGTGVRWATRIITGRRLKDNVNGTDLITKFLQETHGKNYKYFLLGATREVIDQAAGRAAALFPFNTLVGHHHGFVESGENADVIDQINRSGAQILFVGMGNPLQERWIVENVEKLKVPLIVAVGGLFNYWAGVLIRAPLWVRKIGMEWTYILLQQPMKWRRYLIGNAAFLIRVCRGKSIPDGK